MIRTTAALCAIGGLALVPATAVSADPAWHPPTYPSAPTAGLPSDVGIPLSLGVTSKGRATLLYGAKKGNLYGYSRNSDKGAWGAARQWRKSAGIRPTSPLVMALGSKLTALWTGKDGSLYTATGSQSSASSRRGPIDGSTASPSIDRVPQGVAYAYGRGGASGSTVLGGPSPAQRNLRSASTIAVFAGSDAPQVRSDVDAAGNQTVVWPQDGMVMFSTRAAGSSTWSPPVALPGSNDGPFALSVAGDGSAVIAYQGNVVNSSVTGISPVEGTPATIPYQAEASVLLVERPSATAPFTPPQTIYTYKPPMPVTFANVPIGVDFPSGMTAATNGKAAVVGMVDETSSTPRLRLTRADKGQPFPEPTVVTDPYVPNQEATTWSFVGFDSAIDKRGNAVIAVGGSTTQGEPDSVIASTSTTKRPAWRQGRDVALCPKRKNSEEGVASGPSVEASPNGGVVVGWACGPNDEGATRGLIGVTAFDTLGPPIASFSTRGARISFALGETANYTLTASKGSRRVRVSGRAAAGRKITRSLRLTEGQWRVTLRATLSSGNATARSKTTKVD
jgi:hypothetical protein